MPQASRIPDPGGSSGRYVFVYGTLRKGGSNDITRLAPAPVRVGAARIAGTLFDLGAYPGLLLQGEGPVVGEVYAISAELEQRLDEIEEVEPQPSGEYDKRWLWIDVGSCRLHCLVYEITQDRLAHAPVIGSGDWMAHQKGEAGQAGSGTLAQYPFPSEN